MIHINSKDSLLKILESANRIGKEANEHPAYGIAEAYSQNATQLAESGGDVSEGIEKAHEGAEKRL